MDSLPESCCRVQNHCSTDSSVQRCSLILALLVHEERIVFVLEEVWLGPDCVVRWRLAWEQHSEHSLLSDGLLCAVARSAAMAVATRVRGSEISINQHRQNSENRDQHSTSPELFDHDPVEFPDLRDSPVVVDIVSVAAAVVVRGGV